jgi:hypothetical protein
MKRGFLILVAVIIAGVGAALVTKHLLRGPSSAWLCHQYGLSPQKVGTIEGLQQHYGSRCGPYCDQMCEANAHLERIALEEGLSQGTMTPGLREAVAETDRIRTQTRIVMLEHFYAVAAELPPEKRRDYLLKVLPLVIDSCGSR